MTAFFASKTPREKLLLVALAVALLVWLGVTQIWAPLQAHRRDIAARIPRIERALALVRAAPATLTAQAPDPRPMATLVTEAADTLGLNISRLQPLGDKVELTLEDAPFETVLLWIETLQRDDGLRLTDATLTRRPAPGIVGATLTMER